MIGFEWVSLSWEAGTRIWDFVRFRGAPYNSDEFVNLLAESTKKAIDLVPELGALNKTEVERQTIALLGILVSVVSAYHRRPSVRINANYMIPILPTDDVVAEAHFCRDIRKNSSFKCFLSLQRWWEVRDNMAERFMLPVEHGQEGNGDPMLFGAPMAYANNRAELVNDTRSRRLWKPFKGTKIDAKIREYFKKHRPHLRSFISYPLVAPSESGFRALPGLPAQVVGIVNIQSSSKRILGLFPGNQRKLQAVIQPILHVLAYHLVKLHNNVGTDGTPQPS